MSHRSQIDMPSFKVGPFSMFVGKTQSGWFSTSLQFAENYDTAAQLDNGVELNIKLDSVTARIGQDSTTEFVLDPATGEKVFAKETKLFGETLGSVSPVTMRAIKVHQETIAKHKANLKKPAIDVTAEPA